MFHLYWCYVNITVTHMLLTSLNVDQNHFFKWSWDLCLSPKKTEILSEAKKTEKNQNTDYLTIKFYIWKKVQKFENLRVNEGPIFWQLRRKILHLKKGSKF